MNSPTNTSQINLRVATHADRNAITDFFYQIGDELGLSTRRAAQKITDVVFENGGAIVVHKNEAMIAALGYFLGEPSRKFANKEVGFIYVTAIKKAHRLTFTGWRGMVFAMQHLRTLGVREIRCHARQTDPYTNRLYAHFAKPIGEDVSLRGDPTILYGNTIENVLAYIERVQARGARRVARTNTIEPSKPTRRKG